MAVNVIRSASGGAGSVVGNEFEHSIGAFYLSGLLAGSASMTQFGLPDGAYVVKLHRQAYIEVDDIVLGLNNGGGVYIQSKERIAAFTPRDDDLRGCLEQFKCLTARMAVGNLTDWPRPLDWKIDRLILAVRKCPRTLYDGISELAKAARSQSDWASFESAVSQTEEGRQSLETCLAVLQDVAPEITLEPEHQLALFQCVQIAPFDVLEASSHSRTEAWRLLGDHVVAQRARVQDAWRVLGEYSATLASAHGVATLDSTRKELSSAGIPLQGFVDYREDFQRLQGRSASEVNGLQTGLPCPGSSAIIEIQRPALIAQILSALNETRLVIVTGSPGCGKSTVLAQFYDQTLTGTALFFRVDGLEGQTPEQLERGLGLAYSVYDVIEHSQTTDSAILIVDALDAARESSQQEAILAFVKAVLDRTGWKVILSMRLYVLNHSRNVRKSLLPYNYRQVAVPELDDAELAQIYQKIPVLQQAVEKLRPSARTLLANPFNLRLLAEILDASTGEALASFLLAIRTQVQLYQEYWIRVIGEGRGRSGVDRDRRIFTALSAAKLMLEDNKMHISKNRLVVSTVGLTCVDELVTDGVFVTGQLAEQLSFFHQTYHDFAIAQALQAASPEQIRAWLKEPERFLGLRIAMRYRLTLDLPESPDQFWDLWGTLIEARDVRYLLRSLPAEILASWPVMISELEPLDRLLNNRPAVAAQCFEQVCKKMLVDPTPQTVEQAAVWLEWASRHLPELTDNTTWWILNIMEMCLKQPGIDRVMRQRISTLAQRVFERYYPNRTDFIERATGFIAVVFPTEEQAEANILRTGLATHEPRICRRVVDEFEQIAQANPSLAADLAVVLVTYTETSTETTQFGQSRILSFTSNRSQDYNMVLWALRVKFPVLLERDFAEAFRVIDAEICHKGSSWRPNPESYQAPLLSQQMGDFVLRYRVNGSTWQYEIHPRVEHESIVDEFRKWFMNKCSEPATDDVISKVMLCLYERNEHPIIWKICLQATTAYPHRLALHIAPLLSFPLIWSQDECRHAAWSALQAVFPNLSTDQRATIEQVLLALPEQVPEELAKYEIRTRDAAIAVLPDEYLVTAEARELRKQILARQTPPPEVEEERFPEAHSHPIDPDEGLQISNEYRASKTYRHIRESLDKLRAFDKEWQNKVPTRAAREKVFPIASNLSEFLSRPQDPPVAPDQAEQAETVISEVAARFAHCPEWLSGDAELAWTRSYLLAASQSPYPSHNPDANSETPEFMSWSPAPRIAAAEGLPYLVANYKQWDDEIRSIVERLWRDPIDAVRLQIVGSLHLFDGVAPEWAWQKTEKSALRETHVGILAVLANYPLSWWFNTRHEEVIRLCVAIVHHDELAGRFSWQLPRALGGLIGLGFVRHASLTAQAEIDTWLSDIPTYTEFIKASLLWTDRFIVEDTTGGADSNQSVRHRAIELYLKVAQAGLRLEQEYLARNQTGEVTEATRVRALLEVQDTLIKQLYFLGQRNLSAEELQRGQRPALDDEQRKRFLVDIAEVLRACSQFGYPSVIHYLIKLCAEVIDLAPQLCVEVLWNIGHANGDPRLIHFENIALQDVITAMNVLLADHLDLLKTSPELGSKLLDILDGFDEVGWPEAQRFILHLEDVLK